MVPGLLLCLPVGLVGLWRRPGLSVGLRATATLASVALLVGVLLTNGDTPAPDEALPAAVRSTTPLATEAATGSAEAVVDPEAAVEPEKSVVPRLVGLTRKQARKQLAAAGLTLVTRELPSARPRGTVLRQDEKRGRSLLSGTTVTVVVAAPYPRVPDIVGDSQSPAARALRQAGFTVRVTTETRTSGSSGIIVRQSPRGTDRAKPGSAVTIVVADVVRPVAPPAPPPQDCTSGYSPCLAPAYDYDCAGGSGDGPEYAYGPIRVTGSDPYDLDRDGDGVACES